MREILHRRFLTGLLVGALLVGGLEVAAHAAANHPGEPSTPITSLRLKMGEYPGLEKEPLKCDGTDVFVKDKMRIEPQIGLSGPGAEGRPSEHWSFTLAVLSPVAGRSVNRTLWNVLPTSHQNAPKSADPGFEGAEFEQGQYNEYQMQAKPGQWLITAKVEGEMSGRIYEAECPFTVAAP